MTTTSTGFPNPPLPPTDINFFALTNYRNQQRKFGIKADDRRRHMYLIGKTGMGKSSTLENMIINDIRAGHGMAIIDPHGDTVEKIIKYIPSHRINDVIFFNPSDVDHPVAFNILESVNPQYKNLIASGLVGVFKKIWADSWGPRLEYILINTILALLEYPGSTLLGVPRLLVDKHYRKKIVDTLTDPVVKAFWVNEYANYNERFRSEAISPIQNKVGQFLSSSVIRNIVGQSKSTIDMRDAMDGSKILLINLSKGRIGEENSALLGAMMITRLQVAAMSRVDIPEEQRKDFYLYVDEFQNFSTDSFADILSEARKYRLNLIIAHQYIEQLSETVQAAVFGNVGTILSFRVGAADAEFLEKEFAPFYTETDLVNLPKYEIYLKLMIDGVASQPFSAFTLPPISGEEGTQDNVIQVSRERYSKPREVVEEKIWRWSGVEEMYRETAEEENMASGEGRRVQVRSNQYNGNNNRFDRGGNFDRGESRQPRVSNYNRRPPRQEPAAFREQPARERSPEQPPQRPSYTPPPRQQEPLEDMLPAAPRRRNTLLGGTSTADPATSPDIRQSTAQQQEITSLNSALKSSTPAAAPRASVRKPAVRPVARPAAHLSAPQAPAVNPRPALKKSAPLPPAPPAIRPRTAPPSAPQTPPTPDETGKKSSGFSVNLLEGLDDDL